MIIALTCLIAIAAIAFILGVRPKDLPEPEPVSPFAHLDERRYRDLRSEHQRPGSRARNNRAIYRRIERQAQEAREQERHQAEQGRGSMAEPRRSAVTVDSWRRTQVRASV